MDDINDINDPHHQQFADWLVNELLLAHFRHCFLYDHTELIPISFYPSKLIAKYPEYSYRDILFLWNNYAWVACKIYSSG